MGQAAHITAAAPGGPRYDAALSASQRAAAENGLWLCQNCGKLIDSDPEHYSEDLLRQWKRHAKNAAFVEVSTGRIQLPENAPISAADDVWAAAAEDLEKFRARPGFPAHAISLSLSIQTNDRSELVTAHGLAAALEIEPQMSISAAPGAGKSTTLIQIGASLLAKRVLVPVLIPLKEWAVDTKQELLAVVVSRDAFRAISKERLKELATQGRLAVLLDAWNELNGEAKNAASTQLDVLRRDYPNLRIIGTTRQEINDAPFFGPKVEIQALSEDQQLTLVHTIMGAGGAELMERAWRTPGLRELASNPLYLTVLTEQSPQGKLPETKYDILKSFVCRSERPHSLTLRYDLEGVHPDILATLAMAMNVERTTSFAEDRVRSEISAEMARLQAKGQLADLLRPARIVDALVAHHLLVRSGATFSFQHQQFQEWYASRRVERMILDAESDPKAAAKLAADVMNWRDWDETLLFAVESLSRADAVGQRAVAAAILEALRIDPMLAAEMIFRSPNAVWSLVAEQTHCFAKRWHKPETIDRAVRFMVSTGRQEFSEMIWPLVANPDINIHLGAMRAANRFRPGVLGRDSGIRLAALPDEVRRHALCGLACDGDFEGMTLAADIARHDTDPKIRAEVVSYLLFRHCTILAAEAVRDATDEVWTELARRDFDDEFDDPAMKMRIANGRRKLAKDEKSPLARLALVGRPGVEESGNSEIVELIKKADFGSTDHRGNQILRNLLERHPVPVAEGLLHRVAVGSTLPFLGKELLTLLGVVDDGPVAELALRGAGGGHNCNYAVLVVGPKTVAKMIEQLLSLRPTVQDRRQPAPPAQINAYYALVASVQMSRAASFGEAVLLHADEQDVDARVALAELIAGHGQDRRGAQDDFAPEMGKSIAAMVVRWAEAFVALDVARPRQFFPMIGALRRVAHEISFDVLAKLLAKDLERFRNARKQYFATKSDEYRESATSGPNVHELQSAFTALGGQNVIDLMITYLRDPEFGFHAAHVIKAIETGPAKDEDSRLSRWPDFSNISELRMKFSSATEADCSAGAAQILKCAQSLIAPGGTLAEQSQAVALSIVAFTMPCGGHDDLVRSLLALPLPVSDKRTLLITLAAAGFLVPADLVLDGVRDWLACAEKDWQIKERDRFCLQEWLGLLPMSERIASVLEALDLLPADHRGDDLIHLVDGLGHNADGASLSMLFEVARREPALQDRHEWMQAVLRHRRPAMALALVDFAIERGTAAKISDVLHLSREIAPLVARDVGLRRELLRRYECSVDGSVRQLLERIFASAADAEIVLAMVRNLRESGHTGATRDLHHAIECVVTERRPTDQRGLTFEIHPVNAQDLRRGLFSAVREDGADAALAAWALTVIDQLRDGYGPPDGEPRHPDISSSVSWPIEAGSNL